MKNKKSYFKIEDMKIALLEIIKQMKESNWFPEIIFSINRGGCVPGVYLSHAINVPHHVIDVQLRDNNSKPNLYVLENYHDKKKNILIIDDINDSGATFNLIKNHMKKYIVNLNYASLIENKSSNFKADFKGKLIDKTADPTWIVFPWEYHQNSYYKK